MYKVLLTRLRQGFRTMAYPGGPPPALPQRFAGRPAVDSSRCLGGCTSCGGVCPTGALSLEPAKRKVAIDTGKCLFCRACEACPGKVVTFSGDYAMAAASRQDLIVTDGSPRVPAALNENAAKLFGRSLKLRQVSAGGCNACEADCNVLTTLAWDIGRFGISFVASPRHADGLLITGPVSENMKLALEKTYKAVPSPKIVIAAGSCAIAGGPYVDHPEVCNGAASVVPVDLFIPGCPPNPLTILDGMLRFLARDSSKFGVRSS